MPVHPKGSGAGYVITVNGKTIYHAGDTDFIPEMRELGEIFLALLPCGGKYTMDSPDAVEAALAINPKIMIPMHRLDSDLEKLREQVENSSATSVLLLTPGQEHELG